MAFFTTNTQYLYDQNTDEILSNAFKDTVLKVYLLWSYDFGSVKFTIMKYI